MMAAGRQEDFRRDPYGFFSDDGMEYVLIQPNTPRPWQHQLSNEEYLLSITQWAGGYSVYKSTYTNIVTRKSWPDEDAGRFFYLRDRETGKFWSPTVWPAHNNLNGVNDYHCRYGLGYLTWETIREQLRSRMTVAVAMDDCIEMYLLELENLNDNPRIFDVFGFLEWQFSGAPGELGAALHSYFDESRNCSIGDLQLPPQYRARQTGFLTCDRPVISYDGWRSSFVGLPGNVSRPQAVVDGRCGNKRGPIIGNNCGAIHTQVEIPANSSVSLSFLVGIVDRIDEIEDLCERYLQDVLIRAEMQRIEQFWCEKLVGFDVSGPQSLPRGFVNTWLKYQVYQNARWTRWGDHKGYRDVLQDAAGVRLLDRPKAKRMVITAASKQMASGHAPRQWSITPWVKDDWRDYRDSCFWLVYGLEKYLKETGETRILAEALPFVDRQEPATLFEHAHRAVEFLCSNRGGHGLCLIGRGDWLDSLNAAGTGGKGESVWLTQAACYGLREMEQIARLAGRKDNISLYRQWKMELSEAVNTAGWDDQWYLMAYNDLGERIGSSQCPDGGKIFLNPQSWAILADVASEERAKLIMASADEMLSSPWGYLCFAPMYTRFDPNVGRICLWPTEGASVYCHAVLFKVMADCLLGEGDRAWRTLNQITPGFGEMDLTQCGAEPFSYPNCYAGPEWPHPGRSFAGWWTGTASWAMTVFVEWIFGARADWGGLRIDPCLPKCWTKAHIHRLFRGCTYNIDIAKPDSISKGEVRLTVDGKAIQGNLIVPSPDGQTHDVQCEVY